MTRAAEDISKVVREAETLREKFGGVNTPRNGKLNRLNIVRLGDLLAEPDEQIPWLVDDFLPTGWLSGLFAKPKVGKSTFARCLALAVARGGNFLNRRTSQGIVFYISLEEKKQTIKNHFSAMGATSNDPIYIFAGTAFDGFLNAIIGEVKEKKPTLLILDTLVRATRVKDVNDYGTTTEALNPLLEIAHILNCHVMVLHHVNKSINDGGSDAVLGSTSISGSVDISVFLTREEQTRYIWTEGRTEHDLDKTVLTFDSQSRSVGLGATKEAQELAETGKRIREFLENHERCPEKEIIEGIEGRNALKIKALREEIKIGRIIREGKGRKTEPYLYSLHNPVTLQVSSSQNILVPDIPDPCPVQWVQEQKNGEKAHYKANFSCTRDLACSEEIEKTREQEKSTERGAIGDEFELPF